MATQTNGGLASMVKGKVTAHGDIIQGGPSTYPYAPTISNSLPQSLGDKIKRSR